MMKQQLADILLTGCQQLDISPSEAQVAQLVDYTLELARWNKAYNLTAVRDVEAMMKRHVLDALSVLPAVSKHAPKYLADIGTGGGVPGVILAIMQPTLTVYLVESIGKKCRFLRHVVGLLRLSERVVVVQARVEKWQPETPLSIVICRAFTSLENFVTITDHLGDEQTLWLAMKAEHIDAELNALPAPFTLVHDERLQVPFESAKRHLLTFRKQTRNT